LLKRRLIALFAVFALSLGTSSCSLSSDVASLQPYAPSDGQQVSLENIKARNFIYLVSDSGKGYLIGSLVNTSNEDVVMKLEYVNSETSERNDYYYEIPAGSKADFGYNGNPAIDVPVVEKPGATAQFYVLESDTVSGGMRVPVLDGTLQEYRMLLEQLEAAN
jgi:hypothetical protein